MLRHDDTVVYYPQEGYALCTTAKRYWLPELEANSSVPEALTLILLHSTSFHKETWEPSLEKLLELSVQAGSPVKIREAWALDCPNHGEAGQLNESKLAQPEFRNNFSCDKYAKYAHRFLSAGPDHGARVDFRKRNLVGIGHSLGGNAMLILQHLEPMITFTSLIIVEPMISPAGPQFLVELRATLVQGAYERRDVWPDREQAMIASQKRQSRRKWDPRITELFVKYAIMPHPSSTSSETPYHGVTLACSREQEATMYRDADGPTQPVKDLNRVCTTRPVHLILGAVNDFIPAGVHAAILDPKSGRTFASVKKLEGVGHLIPQETPGRLGEAIYKALVKDAEKPFKPRL